MGLAGFDVIFGDDLRLDLEAINENKNALAFKDISPRAPVHILIVPKKGYINYHDFVSNSSKEEIIDLNELIKAIITEMKLDHSGYRIITNSGDDGNQDVNTKTVESDWVHVSGNEYELHFERIDSTHAQCKLYSLNLYFDLNSLFFFCLGMS